MANKVADNLSDVLDIDADIVEAEEVPTEIIEAKDMDVIPNNSSDTQQDYEFSRKNIHDVIKKTTEALDSLLAVAKQSEHPRSFEVVGQLTRTLVDANRELLNIQQKMKELNQADDANPDIEGGTNIQNALFVGTTADLQTLMNKETAPNDNENNDL